NETYGPPRRRKPTASIQPATTVNAKPTSCGCPIRKRIVVPSSFKVTPFRGGLAPDAGDPIRKRGESSGPIWAPAALIFRVRCCFTCYPTKQTKHRRGPCTLADSQPDHPAPDAGRFNSRTFLAREWPYFLVLILALFGVAYTSFAKTPMTAYWVVLAPVIGLICVVTRWGDAETREQRVRLIWTQSLHWAAVLVAMRLMFVADVSRMMNADASALAAL